MPKSYQFKNVPPKKNKRPSDRDAHTILKKERLNLG